MNEDKFLGKKVGYKSIYDNKMLVFVPRLEKRKDIGYLSNETVDFKGFDMWNAYELSWLDNNGKPQVMIGFLIYDATSENIVESKSLKLYFNTFNMTKFPTKKDVINTVTRDLKKGLGDSVNFRLFDVDNKQYKIEQETSFICIDDIEIKPTDYEVNKNLLEVEEGIFMPVYYNFMSNLLKSNCLVTHQPDWATVYISIIPDKKIVTKESLLKYIISFRQHNEFHEQCCERIYHDLFEKLEPLELNVFCKYTRRGGIDINPYRTSDKSGYFKNKMLKEMFYRDPRQ